MKRLEIDIRDQAEMLIALAMEVEHNAVSTYEARDKASSSHTIASWFRPCFINNNIDNFCFPDYSRLCHGS